MNRKQKIIVSVVGITIVLLALLGLTYAYFLTRIQGNTNDKSISVTTANLELTYADGNGTITSNNIMPGTTLTDKEFTVTNNGNATVNNYAVYLEDLVNELTRPDDMVYTLTCTSSKENGSCVGKSETAFPKLAGIIVTNSIDVGETQTYKLTVTYKEMGVDQSDDMGKKVSARVQIYNLQDIVDVTGTVTNASEGDYVEMHSDPRKSMITTDNKYLIAAVEPGTHTLYVKDKEGTVKGSKEITIKKGNTASVSGTNITVTNDSQTVNVNIKAIASTLTIDIGETKDYMPFEEGTLAYNILNNAKLNANGTEFVKSPITKPIKGTSGIKYNKSNDPVTFSETFDNVSNYYIAYATEYEIDEDSGNFSLGTKTSSVKIEKFSGSLSSKLKGKYIYLSENEEIAKKNVFSKIYKVSTDEDIIDDTIKCASILKEHKVIDESVLSITDDDYGNSYYFRGSVNDNYVEFNNMCFRVVRIAGDGSIKIILAKEDLCSTISTSDTKSALINNGATTIYGYNSVNNKYVANYNNTINGLYFTLQKWFNSTGLESKKSKLKNDTWCLGGGINKYDTSGKILDNSDSTIEDSTYYYLLGLRIFGHSMPKQSSLKCSQEEEKIDSYFGTLTVDEYGFAGGSGITNDTFYLADNAKGSYIWTLSKVSHISSGDILININKTSLLSTKLPNYKCSVMPVITLLNNTKIISGDGTISNPYKILES